MKITQKTTIIDILEINNQFINYLSNHGIRCIRCGEPIWGTLEEAAIEKGYNHEQIEKFVEEMNLIIQSEIEN